MKIINLIEESFRLSLQPVNVYKSVNSCIKLLRSRCKIFEKYQNFKGTG